MAPLQFDIEPGVGALPIRFGARAEEVHEHLGQADSRHERWGIAGISENFLGTSVGVGYDTNGIVDHIGFVPGAFTLTLLGRKIWSPSAHPDPNRILLEYEPCPLEYLGFLIFDSLGVTTAGYHEDDESQLSITVYPEGTWADALTEASVPNLTRYKQAQ